MIFVIMTNSYYHQIKIWATHYGGKYRNRIILNACVSLSFVILTQNTLSRLHSQEKKMLGFLFVWPAHIHLPIYCFFIAIVCWVQLIFYILGVAWVFTWYCCLCVRCNYSNFLVFRRLLEVGFIRITLWPGI